MAFQHTKFMEQPLAKRIQQEKQKKPTIWVGVKACIINSNGEVLILKRSPENTNALLWDIPGGKMAWGESVDKALKREIQEETGLTLTHVGPVISVSSFIRKIDKNSQVVRLIFACTTKKTKITLSDEHMESLWVPATQLRKYTFMDAVFSHAFKNLKNMLNKKTIPLVKQSVLLPGLVY